MQVANADLRSAEVIKRTVNVFQPSVLEIGVYKGEMSRRLLYHPDLNLTIIDPWGDVITDTYKASGDAYALHTKEKWQEIKQLAIDNVKWAKGRVEVFHGTSEAAASYFDEIYDIIFIDGDHSYEATSEDIELWWGSVIPGGHLGGHDYRVKDNYGVIQAVDEFIEKTGLPLELGENYCWFVRKPNTQ